MNNQERAGGRAIRSTEAVGGVVGHERRTANNGDVIRRAMQARGVATFRRRNDDEGEGAGVGVAGAVADSDGDGITAGANYGPIGNGLGANDTAGVAETRRKSAEIRDGALASYDGKDFVGDVGKTIAIDEGRGGVGLDGDVKRARGRRAG